MPLSDSTVRRAKPAAKPYKLFDREGLYLIVNPTGSKWWRFKYYIGGREKLLSLGVYDDVSLKDARERRDDARQLVAKGLDPSAKRKTEKDARADTFRSVAEEWLAKQEATLEPETMHALKARLERWVYGAIGNEPIGNLGVPELLRMLRHIESKGRHDTAHRVRAACGRIFCYAIATERAKVDPTPGLKGALSPLKVAHRAALIEPPAVGALLRAIDGYRGHPVTEIALRMIPYVFVRPGELRGAEWTEFHRGGPNPEWRIPAQRMKMDRHHIVPLAKQVMALLSDLEVHTGGGRLAFPTTHDPMRPLSENTLSAALRRLGYSSSEMTVHGFRTTASTLLNERGFNPELIELQLAHVDENETRAAYNRAFKLARRRVMMQAWADYLDELRGAQ